MESVDSGMKIKGERFRFPFNDLVELRGIELLNTESPIEPIGVNTQMI